MICSVLAAALVGIALSSAPLAQMPPPECWWHGTVSAGVDTSQHSLAYGRTDTKTVTIQWRFFPDPPKGDGRVLESTEYDTRYWPTYATSAGGWNYYVAGKRASGKTVIERWNFSAPIVSATQGGFSLTPGARTSVDIVYDEQTAGRDILWQMTRMEGAQDDRLLVRFHDSKQVYIFDPATSGWTLVASPTAYPGALTIPELAEPFASVSAKNHLTHGHVYTLQRGGTLEKSGQFSLVLIDGDRDGDIDSHVIADEATWAAMGLGDASQYQ